MYECFLEIAFEADLDTSEDPELLELAEKLCNENQATRASAITELRKMIFDREECFPFRTDDEFLLRFLRAKHFIVPKAHRLLVRYCTFRQEHKQLYDGVDLWALTKVKKAYGSNMYDHPDVGRVIMLRFGYWDTNEFGIEVLVSAAMAVVELAMRLPKFQVLGGTILIDLQGITLKHISLFTPTVAYQIVCLMGLAIPLRYRAIHVINYSWMLSAVFYIFKRFVPQHVWDTIHFHGNDIKSLQRYIRRDCLLPEYGGTCRSGVSLDHWLRKIKKYRNEQFDQEMKQIGYVIKE